MMTKLEEGSLFAKRYNFQVLTELPSGSGDTRRFYYPGAKLTGGKDGLIVRVVPVNGQEWVGVFATGDEFGTLLNGVFTCPDEDMICVVSGGIGYLVHASTPEWSSEVPVAPITRVLQMPESDILVVASFTDLSAWGRDGLRWRTKRLVWDELRVTAYDNRRLSGIGFDPTQSEPVRFSVDLRTGEHEGGSSPETYERRTTT